MDVLCWEQPVLICFVLISPGGPTDGSLRDRNVQQPWHVRERCLFMRAGIHRGEMWYVYSSRVVALVLVHTALITVGYSYTSLLSLLVSFSFQQARPSLRAINTIGPRRHGANVPRIAARTAFVNEPCGAKTTKRNNGPWIQCVWARWKVLKIAIVLSAKALWVSVASFY
jgi:hypothetical protein